MRRGLCHVTVAALITLTVAAAATDAQAKQSRGTLAIAVKALPARMTATVTVTRGHAYHKTFTAPRTITVPAGHYTITGANVTLTAAYKNVPAGSTAFANAPVAVRVGAHQHAHATVTYDNIRSALTQPLTKAPQQVTGPTNNPTGILLPLGSNVTDGSILSSGPTTELPYGLFDRVTAVTPTPDGIEASLTPATLLEAFPRLNIGPDRPPVATPPKLAKITATTRIARATPGASGDAPEASSAPFPPIGGGTGANSSADAGGVVDLSQMDSKLESDCGAPQGSITLTPGFSLDPSVHGGFHWNKTNLGVVSIPTGAHGYVSATLTGSLSLTLTAQAAFKCEKTIDTPFETTMTLWIGEVPVPIEVAIKLHPKIDISAAVSVTAKASVWAYGEVTFSGGLTSLPHLTANVQGNASATLNVTGKASGEVSFAPLFQLGVGMDAANVHVNVGPALDFQATLLPTPSCSLALEAEENAGVTLGVESDLGDFTQKIADLLKCPGSGKKPPTTPAPPGSPPAPTGGGERLPTASEALAILSGLDQSWAYAPEPGISNAVIGIRVDTGGAWARVLTDTTPSVIIMVEPGGPSGAGQWFPAADNTNPVLSECDVPSGIAADLQLKDYFEVTPCTTTSGERPATAAELAAVNNDYFTPSTSLAPSDVLTAVEVDKNNPAWAVAFISVGGAPYWVTLLTNQSGHWEDMGTLSADSGSCPPAAEQGAYEQAIADLDLARYAQRHVSTC